MEAASVQKHIQAWLDDNHAAEAQRDVLLKVMAVGKSSHAWVAAIQRYIQGKCLQSPSRGEIKMACRALLERSPS